MNNLSLKKFVLLLFVLILASGSSEAQIFHKNPEKQLFGKSHINKNGPKVKEPGKVLKAKKKQEANDRKLKKDSEKSVKRSQKRTVDIQTPEVQARMKKNKKEVIIRDKENKKKVKDGSKRAGKKYN